tara:strand:- start:10 stop:444 length:435 start_codon:yes stop_codon:yes gene_type:complete
LVIEKSPQAFRTISEASEILSLPSHVLRFWESKFKQIKPLKRAGGRRYYRPNDILFILGIKKLLHIDGLTISGVKRLIKENGINHIINIGKAIKVNNLNFQKKEPLLKKINAQKSNINKKLINDAIEKLNFLKLKIGSRISNDF